MNNSENSTLSLPTDHLCSSLRCAQMTRGIRTMSRALESALRHDTRPDILHLQAASPLLFGSQRSGALSPRLPKPLVALDVLLFEMEVSRWPRAYKNSDPILEEVSLCERPMTVFLRELVGLEQFASRLSASHEVEMVSGKRQWVDGHESPVYYHREWDTIGPTKSRSE